MLPPATSDATTSSPPSSEIATSPSVVAPLPMMIESTRMGALPATFQMYTALPTPPGVRGPPHVVVYATDPRASTSPVNRLDTGPHPRTVSPTDVAAGAA